MNEKPIVVLEMANNHNGQVDRAYAIIDSFHEVKDKYDKHFQFVFKFQYRNIESCIAPNADEESKYVKRYRSANLELSNRYDIKLYAEMCGFMTACTPWDEKSVDHIYQHKYDYMKIASCHINDYPLLEKIVNMGNMPIIASTGIGDLRIIDKLVSYLEHKEKSFSLMHCVALYPTPANKLRLNRIAQLKKRYPQIEVGYSTHEKPDMMITGGMAYALGARIFEKHVDLDDIKRNSYSVTSKQLYRWLNKTVTMMNMMTDNGTTDEEIATLKALQRGAYTDARVGKGELFTSENMILAFPRTDNMLPAEEISIHNKAIIATRDYQRHEPIDRYRMYEDTDKKIISEYIHRVKGLLAKARIVVNEKIPVAISYHYGLDKLREYGCMMINSHNNEKYCKTLLVMLPGQVFPSHYHKQKDETLNILYGDMILNHKAESIKLAEGEQFRIKIHEPHCIIAGDNGVIIEEISTTYYAGDTIYESKVNENRKTTIDAHGLRW